MANYRLAWLLAPMLIAGNAPGVPAQEMDVAASVQIPLLYKILTFDRNFAARAGDDIVIAILYQSGFRASTMAREQVEHAFGHTASPFGAKRIRWVAVELEAAADLAQVLNRHEADVVYVTPLRGTGLTGIVDVARRSHLMTFTGVPPYVERGLSVGIGIEQERPMILINLAAARAEGADYTAQLLRVSRVIGEGR
jgi:hypothetical protein